MKKVDWRKKSNTAPSSTCSAALRTALAPSLHRLDLSSTGLTSQQLEAVLECAGPPLSELSLFSLDMASVREGVLREVEKRVVVSHRLPLL